MVYRTIPNFDDPFPYANTTTGLCIHIADINMEVPFSRLVWGNEQINEYLDKQKQLEDYFRSGKWAERVRNSVLRGLNEKEEKKS